MIDIATIKDNIKIGIYQAVEIGEYHSMKEYNMNRITEIALGIIRITEMILEAEILGEIWDQIRIIEDKTAEMGSFQIMPEGKTEVVVIGLDQVQDLVLIDIALDVINVESTIILQKTALPQNREGNRTSTTDV